MFAPDAFKVTVAVRGNTVVFAEAENIKFAVPEVVILGVKLNHVLLSELAVHAVFADIFKLGDPATCVTVIVFELTLELDIVTVAVRVVMLGFASAVIVTVALPVLVVGLKLSHD